jgi:hypothetical protein
LGYGRSGIEPCGGVDPLLKERKIKVRAGAGNLDAPTHNDTERKKKKKKENSNVEEIDRTVSGCLSGRVRIRRERWQWLESGYRNPEKNHKRKHRTRKRRCCKRSPRKKRNRDTPLGYSGRTALRREQCGVPA